MTIETVIETAVERAIERAMPGNVSVQEGLMDRLLSAAETHAKMGVSKSTFWRRTKAGAWSDFPSPVRGGRDPQWSEISVNDYIRRLVSETIR